MNLNPAARQRHQLRVITVGFFRMLKCTLTNRVVKSKMEITALKSFLDWLTEQKANDPGSKGIVLIYHEPIKFTPFMLLEAFKKYELLERFSDVVAGFVDGHALSESKCSSTVKYSSLKQLAKVFFNYEEDLDDAKYFEGNAAVRARLAYQVVAHLAKGLLNSFFLFYFRLFNFFGLVLIFFFLLHLIGEQENVKVDSKAMTELIQGFVHSVKIDIGELSDQNKCIDLQHSFRPVFVQFFKTNLYHRYKAVTFRRVLAENGFDLKSLEAIWNDKKKDGLTEIVSKLDDIKEENRAELVDILDSYFDPEKEPIVPAVKKSNRIRRRSYKKGSDKENRKHNSHTDGEHQGSSPESRSPRKNRRPRRRYNTKRDLSKTLSEDTKPTLVNENNPIPVINVTSVQN